MIPNLESHESFDRLCALVAANEASPEEERLLMTHLAECPDCKLAFEQFQSILVHTKADIAIHEDENAPDHAVHTFEHATAKHRAIEACRHFLGTLATPSGKESPASGTARWVPMYLWMGSIAAAGVLALSFQFLHRTPREHSVPAPELQAANLQDQDKVNQLQDQLAKSVAERQAASEKALVDEHTLKSLSNQNTELQAHLSDLSAAHQQATTDLEALRDRDRLLEASLDVLKNSNRELGSDKAALSQKIDNLTISLQDSRQQLDGVKNQNEELARTTEEQSKHSERQQRLLATDTDIRDILGARSLHIIDVYDVGDNGQMERPFGRLFYTEGKSLIFYGFDLDRQKGLKTNAVFRAWGEKDQPNSTPYSLGAFYVDDKTQNRWVLKFDDSKVLSKIDYVFVTDSSSKAKDVLISRKKSLLYASLR